MKLQISFGFLIFFAFLVILIPIKWVLCWLAAQVLHEAFHIIALKCCKYHITVVRFGYNGMEINGDFDERLQMIFCALAGPCAGIVLYIVFGKDSILGICGLCQSAFNLLPVYPLDGGRSIRMLLLKLAGRQSGLKAFCILELLFLTGCIILLTCFSIFQSQLYLVFLLICIYILSKKLLAKNGGRLYNTNSFY